MRILVVDDDVELLGLVHKALERDDHQVLTCTSGEAALQLVKEMEPDIVLVDLGLPGISGEELTSKLRCENSRVAILVLTAQSAVSSRVRCLDNGSDDYLTKPFAIAELRARVRALSRRIPKSTSPQYLQCGEIVLDFASRRATKCGEVAPITSREWSILELLASHCGKVVERREIIERVWQQPEDASVQASLEVLIGRIRRKLSVELVATVRGQGYRLEREEQP